MDEATRELLQEISTYLFHVACEARCDCEPGDPTFQCSTCEAKGLAARVDDALGYSVKGQA